MGDLTVYVDDGVTDIDDTTAPDKKVYVKLSEVADNIIPSTSARANATVKKILDDDDYFKFKYKKGSDNSKMILDIVTPTSRSSWLTITLTTSTRSIPPLPLQ